jgi:hypothetical protein
MDNTEGWLLMEELASASASRPFIQDYHHRLNQKTTAAIVLTELDMKNRPFGTRDDAE